MKLFNNEKRSVFYLNSKIIKILELHYQLKLRGTVSCILAIWSHKPGAFFFTQKPFINTLTSAAKQAKKKIFIIENQHRHSKSFSRCQKTSHCQNLTSICIESSFEPCVMLHFTLVCLHSLAVSSTKNNVQPQHKITCTRII